jgi:chloramphenicol O-acetyltransferase
MTHPVPDGMIESNSVPRACFSKYIEKDGKYNLNFTINVSHVLVDGYPLCKALNALTENSINCLNFFNNTTK